MAVRVPAVGHVHSLGPRAVAVRVPAVRVPAVRVPAVRVPAVGPGLELYQAMAASKGR